MEIFIKEFRTTNELLLKTQSNLLSELVIEVSELAKVMSNVLIQKNKVKGATTKGGRMTFEAAHIEEINETRIDKNKPPRFEQNAQEKLHDDGVENKSLSIPERTTQPSNLKQLDINISFIEALVQIPKYAKYLKSLLTNKSELEEACMETMNERCSTVLLNKLPIKEKDPTSFTNPCQVLKKHKEAEDLAVDHSSRLENPHMEVLTERKITDEFYDEHLMVLKSKSKDDEPWYADFVNYIVGKAVPPNWTFEKRKGFFSETLENLAHCHSGPTGGHHSANVTTKKVYESRPSVFKDANEAIKCILQRSVGYNSKGWSEKIYDALWAFRTAYKTPTGCTPFRLVYGKACYLPVEIEHKAHLALKQCNMDLTLASRSHLMQLNELAGLRDGDQVLLYNSRLKMYPGKLKSKWSGPNFVKMVYPHGAIEITDKDGFSFKVNGQQLKKYYEGNIDKEDDEVIEFNNGVT
ncbi:reverse transcriptase domain-containing protein [Tanacetum coccineum]